MTTGPVHWGRPIPNKDGKTIFSRGIAFRGELSRFDVQSKQLQPFLEGGSAEFVSFSKDNQAVAYVSLPEGILWKARRDGSGPVQLSEPPMYVSLPRWSPDGTQILFMSMSSQGRSSSYVVSSEGGSPQKLFPEDDGQQTDPNWSPEGRKIVFSTSRPRGGDPICDIRILDLDSRQVTSLPGSAGMFSPRWSPDGQFIAAMPGDSSGLRIFRHRDAAMVGAATESCHGVS